MLLLNGGNLESKREFPCNLADLRWLERHEATACGGLIYCVVEIGNSVEIGTAVAPDTTPRGPFFVEIVARSARAKRIHKFQGLTTADSMYLIMPDRFGKWRSRE